MFWYAYILWSLLNGENYHPLTCNVTQYKFVFISNHHQYLVHGLWPETCSQCSECGYPTCCNPDKFGHFTMPDDTSFIDQHWLGGRNPQPGHVCNLTTRIVFEHEVLKHASCMGLFAEEYLHIVIKLFDQYQSKLPQLCSGKTDCVLDLDSNFNLIADSWSKFD